MPARSGTALARLVRAAAVSILVLGAAHVPASHTPPPTSVALAASFQSELGCPDDWRPECDATFLAYDASAGLWLGTFSLPAGSWEYKAALNGTWAENYGLHAAPGGANIALALAAPQDVKFYYDHETHWITDDVSGLIVTAPGSYQSELGCSGDWQPECLRSWLQDPDGDGVSTMTRVLPAGDYEVKAAIRESWSENYGAGGVPGGANIPFSVSAACGATTFSYDSATHVLSVSASGSPPEPASVTVAGSLQSEMTLGACDDWAPWCGDAHLAFDAEDGVWQKTWTVPAGAWEYKAALNDEWTENYGQNATRNGANIALNLADAAPVKFYYSSATHWIADDHSKVIATVAGDFQSELGCAADWQPGCLRSWLQDPDGDGISTFTTRALPAGTYQAKVAIGESWTENYGAGGARDGANIAFTVPASCAETVFTYDAATHVLTIGATGGPRGSLAKAQAHWVAPDTIAWNPTGFTPTATVLLHFAPTGGLVLDANGVSGGTAFALTYDPAGLPADVKAAFPHLAAFKAFKVSGIGDVGALLTGQLAVSAVAADGTPLDATSLQLPGVLDALFAYDGPLGVTFANGVPTLRVWAPTAQLVRLELFDDAGAETTPRVLEMTRGAKGVWSVTGDAAWKGKFYRYQVAAFVRATARVEVSSVTDPYSVSLSTNSQRSQLVDLADPALMPKGWTNLEKPRLDAPEDIVLYELHVRDFSATDESVPAAWRGTYRAFQRQDTNGMRHLRALAKAGLTHVHLLPTFDFATVDEDRSTWRSPAGDLASFPPDGTEQQAAVEAVRDADGFNWGYDPWHWGVPEGSYATDPNGPARILEYRQMVMGLADAGLRVVNDVVFNHTTASGQNAKSVLDRIVPGYYHRLDLDGNVERSTCCENTASEHAMMEKLLVDTTVLWAKAYKIDGFRFDLMGHHLKRNMLRLRAALDALTLAKDGVDGRKIYLYGEGWNFGEVANDARGVTARQANLCGTGIGSFSDRLRDGARGGGPFSGIQEQGFLTGLAYDPNATNQGSAGDQLARLLLEQDWVRLGLAGNLRDFVLVDRNGAAVPGSAIDYNGQPAGYACDPQETITYVEAHDNETLFDAIQLKVPRATSMADRVRVQNLGMSLVGLSQGIPFFHAGVDLLRSKSLDRNSYDSGDWFNRLDFTYTTNDWGVGLPRAADNQASWPILAPLLADPALAPSPNDLAAAAAHFREVLAIRKSTALFRLRTAADVLERVGVLGGGPGAIPGLAVMTIADPGGTIDKRHPLVAVVINANDEAAAYAVPALAGQRLALHPILAASADPVVRGATFDAATGTFRVPARTAAVFWVTR